MFEIQKLSEIFRFSLNHFMGKEFCIDQDKPTNADKKAEKLKERMSGLSLNVHKCKNILLYILERRAGKPNVGETILSKLLYFIDFNYYELHEEQLTVAKYLKLSCGTFPQKLDVIVT